MSRKLSMRSSQSRPYGQLADIWSNVTTVAIVLTFFGWVGYPTLCFPLSLSLLDSLICFITKQKLSNSWQINLKKGFIWVLNELCCLTGRNYKFLLNIIPNEKVELLYLWCVIFSSLWSDLSIMMAILSLKKCQLV